MENFRIESLQISQVGPFNDVEIKFKQKQSNDKAEIHILTGGNGTGKSTILQCLSFPKYYNGELIVNKFWTNKPISSFTIGYSSSFPPMKWYLTQGSLQPNHWIPLLVDYSNKVGAEPERVEFDFIVLAYSGYRQVNDFKVTGIQEIQERPLFNANNFANSINPQLFFQWLVNVQTRELIAKGKGDIPKAIKYRSTIEIIEKALGEIIDSEVKFDLEEEPLGVKIKVDGQTLNFDQLPDGLKSMVSWMGDLLMRMDRLKWVNDTPVLERNFILLLDEIEVHLHPAWQRKILPVVQKLFKNAQIFISTHSPFVVGSVDGAWVHRFEKKDGYSVLAGPPILSEDAKSYDYILEEIFGVKERFGVEIERKLQDFQALKASFLAEQRQEDAIRLHQLVKELSGQSTELDSILGMELRQLKRLTNQDFSLTEV